jgi:hypothetical protein
MNASNSNLTETKQLLVGMTEEAAALKQAMGGSITDAVAGWLASQYCSAAHEKLAGAEGARRWDILRAFVQDWAQLRHGDHTAERLQIERERLDLARQESKEKLRTKLDAGLDALAEAFRHSPQAMVLFKQSRELLCPNEQPQKEKELRAWLQRPEIRKELLPNLTRGLSPETLQKIEAELRLL